MPKKKIVVDLDMDEVTPQVPVWKPKTHDICHSCGAQGAKFGTFKDPVTKVDTGIPIVDSLWVCSSCSSDTKPEAL